MIGTDTINASCEEEEKVAKSMLEQYITPREAARAMFFNHVDEILKHNNSEVLLKYLKKFQSDDTYSRKINDLYAKEMALYSDYIDFNNDPKAKEALWISVAAKFAEYIERQSGNNNKLADELMNDHEEKRFSKSQNTLISLIKVLIDPKFMKDEEIFNFYDEIDRIDLHINSLEAIKFFEFLLDENGNIRQDTSNEKLQTAKFKILNSLKYAIMADDIQAIMNLLEILNRPKDVPSLYPQLFPFVRPYPIKRW